MTIGDTPSNWTVLIIEDDPDHLNLATVALTATGATVHAAGNVADGLRLLAEIKPPTVILLDLDMPGTNGWAALKKIRAKPDLAAVPVIAVTAHAMAGDRERALEAGFDGYIPKPFNVVTFVDKIKEGLAGGED